MWYQEPGWYALGTSMLALAVSSFFTWRSFRRTHATHSTYLCDSQFLEIEKLFIANPALYSFYRLAPDMTEYWDKLSEEEKQRYIFAEIHYFHLAFVYREYQARRIPADYWKIYQNWLTTLVQYSPLFLEVHTREAKNFEDDFASLVEEMKKAQSGQKG